MSKYDFTSVSKDADERKIGNPEHSLPLDCYTLAWEKQKGVKHKEPTFLLPLKPMLDNTPHESFKTPVNKPEPTSENLTAAALNAYEIHANRILDWTKNAQTILAQPNPEPAQLARLKEDCTSGKTHESVEALRRSILGTAIPSNLPQLVEPWQEVKRKTRQVADCFPEIAKSITDKQSSGKMRSLLTGVAENLNQVLSDGLDRALALADRLPKNDRANEVQLALAPADKRKADQIKILSAYETVSYYVSTIECAVQVLSERPYGKMEASDWARLERSYRNFQREMNGFKNEFNSDTMKVLETSNELTASQRQILKQFRQSAEQAMPELDSLRSTVPFNNKQFAPARLELVGQMADLQRLTWKISNENNHLSSELSIKEEIKKAPTWKKSLLEQKLAYWQYCPLADQVLDVRNAAWSVAEEAAGATRIEKTDKQGSSFRHRQQLLSAIEVFESDPEVYKNLEEAANCAALTPQQVERLKQFRYSCAQVKSEIDSIKQGAIDSQRRTLLDSVSNHRSGILNTIRAIDREISARELQESTPESLKPLVTQQNCYSEFSRVSDALDDISRDARDVMWLTGGYYPKHERAIKLEEKSNSLLGRISNFKAMVGNFEGQQHLPQMLHSKDLTAKQSAQLSEFYDDVQNLLPQIEQLESNVVQGADKNFWKLSQAVRDRMEAVHKRGFEITLESFALYNLLSKELKNKK